MAKTYFSGISDTNIIKDMLAKNPDLYIQKVEFEGTAQLTATTAGAHVLTVSTASWTVDEFISTSAKNLYLLDNNSVVAACKIADNDATTVTFDEATLLLESDGTTAASLTLNANYSIRIMTPSSTNAQGKFYGLTEQVELSINDEFMQYKYDMPRKMIVQDLMERTGEITGINANSMNEDVLDSILGASTYGSQTSQFGLGVGSNPDTNRYYRLVMQSTDRNGRAVNIILRRVQLGLNGSIITSTESGYKGVSFKGSILSDTFYPDTADMVFVTHAD